MTIQIGQREATPAISTPPVWDMVPFKVTCARCGENLQGRTEPNCPACEFEFDWSDAVPVEHLKCGHCGYALTGLTNCRCPECGTEFTWEGAIAAYHQSRHELFEYRWRDRPVRSFIQTFRLIFRPKVLWQQLDIHDTPRVRPLLFMIAPVILAVPVVLVLLESLKWWVWDLSFAADTGMLSGPPNSISFIYHVRQSLTLRYVYMPALHLMLWVVLTGATLLMLRHSMKRCRILSRQVFRVWAYCVPIPATAALLVNMTTMETIMMTRFRPGDFVIMAFSLVLAVYVTYLLREGYRRYLKMPHAWGVSIAAHLIGLIGAGVIITLVQELLSPL